MLLVIKSSFFLPSISNALKGGLFDYWRRTFYYNMFGKDMDYFNNYLVFEHELNSIDNKQFYKMYLILLAGSLLSIFICMLEFTIIFKQIQVSQFKYIVMVKDAYFSLLNLLKLSSI